LKDKKIDEINFLKQQR